MKLKLKDLTQKMTALFILLFPLSGFAGVTIQDPLPKSQQTFMVMTAWAQHEQIPGKTLFAKEQDFSLMKHRVISAYPSSTAHSGLSGLTIAGLAMCFIILFIFGFVLGPMGITLFRVPLLQPAKTVEKA